MQSVSELPPPPAILRVASLGLVLDGLEESTRAAPPAVRMVVVAGAERGATARTWSTGAAIAEFGAGVGALGGAGSCDVKLSAEDAAGETRRSGGSVDPPVAGAATAGEGCDTVGTVTVGA